MLDRFDKISQFIKKTGEKAFVFDESREYVVIELNEYYRLVEGKTNYGLLNEEGFLQKINREIALWREVHDQDNKPSGFSGLDENDELCNLDPITQRSDFSPGSNFQQNNDIFSSEENHGNRQSLKNKVSLDYFDNYYDRKDEKSIADYYGNYNLGNSTDGSEENTKEDITDDGGMKEYDLAETDSDDFDDDAPKSRQEDDNDGKDLFVDNYSNGDLAPSPDTHLSVNKKLKSTLLSDVSSGKKKINNFGYPNPEDKDYLPPLGGVKYDKNNQKIKKNSQFSGRDFENIPPPPSI